ncbi:hypothetical protein HDK90DRAFT_541864, partial [Phyllosticta capitalensis]
RSRNIAGRGFKLPLFVRLSPDTDVSQHPDDFPLLHLPINSRGYFVGCLHRGVTTWLQPAVDEARPRMQTFPNRVGVFVHAARLHHGRRIQAGEADRHSERRSQNHGYKSRSHRDARKHSRRAQHRQRTAGRHRSRAQHRQCKAGRRRSTAQGSPSSWRNPGPVRQEEYGRARVSPSLSRKSEGDGQEEGGPSSSQGGDPDAGGSPGKGGDEDATGSSPRKGTD